MNEIDSARPSAPLSAQLRGLAQTLRDEQAPAQVLDGIHRRLAPPQRARRTPWRWAALVTACVAAMAWMAVIALAPPLQEAAQDGQAEALDGFVPVAAGERWRDAAKGDAWLVSTELPSARLASLGLPYDPTRAADTVRAQLLMHSSGDVLAVRVIR